MRSQINKPNFSKELIEDYVSRYIPEATQGIRKKAIVDSIDGFTKSIDPLSLRDAEKRALLLLSPCFSETATKDRNSERDAIDRWISQVSEKWSEPYLHQIESEKIVTALQESKYIKERILRMSQMTLKDSLLRTICHALEHCRNEAELTDLTPELRFVEFFNLISSSRGIAMLASKYPRQIILAHDKLRNKLRSTISMLKRFSDDKEEIRTKLCCMHKEGYRPFQVIDITLGTGDAHGCGSSVAIIETTGGKVVYKPRDLSIDQGLYDLFDIISRKYRIDLRVPRVISSDGYGWSEFIDRGRGREASIGDTYGRNVGHLLGLCYILGATDLHYENVIIDSDDRPVIIDLETIVRGMVEEDGGYAAGSAAKEGRHVLDTSVAGVGILPMPISYPGRKGKIHIGVISPNEAGGLSPFRTLSLRNYGRDDMYVEITTTEVSVDNKNPALPSEIEEFIEFRNSVVDGLRYVLEICADNREWLANTMTASFEGAKFRHIHCPTVFYSQILRMVTNPDVSEDPLAYATILSRSDLGRRVQKTLTKYEMKQLSNGDIPAFSALAGGRDILDYHGNVVERDFFSRTAIECINERLNRLDPEEIFRQLDICSSTFVSCMPDGGEMTSILPTAGIDENALESDYSMNLLIENLRARICWSTVSHHPVTFLGPNVSTEDDLQWSLGTSGYDLYGGSPGICLALAEAAQVTGEEYDFDMAACFFEPVAEQILSGVIPDDVLGPGGMMGVSGTLWALYRFRAIRGDVDVTFLKSVLDKILISTENDSKFDLVIGSLGAYSVSTSIMADLQEEQQVGLYRVYSNLVIKFIAEAREVAVRCREIMAGISENDDVYLGYAHGIACIPAIAASMAAIVEEWSSETANELLMIAGEYVDILSEVVDEYGAVPRSFRDSRRDFGWCHGAPGVLLGLSIAADNGADVSREVLDRLAMATRSRGFGNNQTYCHGDFGCYQALIRYLSVVGDVTEKRRIERNAYVAASFMARENSLRGRSRYASSSSLFLGSSGLLYALVEFSPDKQIPTFLSLGL